MSFNVSLEQTSQSEYLYVLYFCIINFLLTSFILEVGINSPPVFLQLFCLVLKVVYTGHMLWGLLEAVWTILLIVSQHLK